MIYDEKYYNALRRPEQESDKNLSESAIDWILTLPPKYRPHELAIQYPRIVNNLAAIWKNENDFRDALSEYIFSSRKEKRKGFDQKTLNELSVLLDNYNETHGEKMVALDPYCE